MKLESGRDIGELKGLTTRQRLRCKDAVSFHVEGGKVVHNGSGTANQLYAMFGLGLKSLDDFDKEENQYSDLDILEISVAVQEADEKSRNPITED